MRWLVWAALIGNALASLHFMVNRNAFLWLLFSASVAINIYTLIKLGGRTTDPRKDTP